MVLYFNSPVALEAQLSSLTKKKDSPFQTLADSFIALVLALHQMSA